MSFFVFEASPVQDENGTNIDQMYLSYEKGSLALHIDKKFKNAIGFTDAVWKKLKGELEAILSEGRVFLERCERVFTLRLHGPHDLSVQDDTMTVKLKLVGKSDREFYDRDTAKKFTQHISETIIDLQNRTNAAGGA